MRPAEEYREALSSLLAVAFRALDSELGDDGECDDLAPHWQDLSDHATALLDFLLEQEVDAGP